MKAKVVAITAVKKSTPRLICMTGTPVSESPLNAYSLVRLLSPELAMSKSKFNSAFTNTVEKFYGGQKIVEIDKKNPYRNLDKLRAIMAGISIRRTLADVKGMPEKIMTTREVALSPEHKKCYNNIARAMKKEGLDAVLGTQTLGAKSLRLRQCLHDPMLLGFDIPSSKFDALEEIADEVLADPMAKMVVWVNFTGSLPALMKRFKAYKPVALNMHTTLAEITHLSKTFDHSDCRMVMATPVKGGTGLDMLSRARVAVYVDLPFGYTSYAQSQDRLIRRTNLESTDPIELLKGSPATIIDLYVPGSMDLLTKKIIERKVDLVEGSDASNASLSLVHDEFLSFIQEIE